MMKVLVTGLGDVESDKAVLIYYINYDHFINVVFFRLHRMYQVQVSNEIFNRSCEKERLVTDCACVSY